MSIISPDKASGYSLFIPTKLKSASSSPVRTSIEIPVFFLIIATASSVLVTFLSEAVANAKKLPHPFSLELYLYRSRISHKALIPNPLKHPFSLIPPRPSVVLSANTDLIFPPAAPDESKIFIFTVFEPISVTQ